jgi:hypothetical protein
MNPTDMAYDLFITSAEERFALDRDYRARVQREAFETDTHIARMKTWGDSLWDIARSPILT